MTNFKFKAWLVKEQEWGDVTQINFDRDTGEAYEVKTIFGAYNKFVNGKKLRQSQWNELKEDEAILYQETADDICVEVGSGETVYCNL